MPLAAFQTSQSAPGCATDMVHKLLLDQTCDTALSISSSQARVGPPWWVCGAFWGDIGALASLPRVAWHWILSLHVKTAEGHNGNVGAGTVCCAWDWPPAHHLTSPTTSWWKLLGLRASMPSSASSPRALCHLCLQVTAQDTTLPAMCGQPSVPHTRSMHQLQPAFARSMHAQQQQRVASRF